IADHPLVLHAAVFAAGAFPVLLGTENPLAEEAVFFGTIGAVVDGLRLLHFAERPTADIMRAGQTDADSPVVVDAIIGRLACAHRPYSCVIRNNNAHHPRLTSGRPEDELLGLNRCRPLRVERLLGCWLCRTSRGLRKCSKKYTPNYQLNQIFAAI